MKKNKQIRPRLSGKKLKAFEYITKNESRILVIGDIHIPYERDEYFDFVSETYNNFNCNQSLFIGDIIDSNSYSFHEPSATNGMSPGNELNLAIKRVKKWHDKFPNSFVTIGNHDRMAHRKSNAGGVPQQWLKSYNDVLKTPSWTWTESVTIDNVLYTHGDGSNAYTKAQQNFQSTCCGHHHTKAGVQYFVGTKKKFFGLQVGCGIDTKSFAFHYAKNFRRQAIGCAVVIGGHTPINVMMEL